MDPNARKPKVILRNCDDYDPQVIRRIVRESMQELGLRPSGRTLIKPNVVSSGPLFEHAHTRPEMVEGVILALRDLDEGMTELAVGERCGITLPTRLAFEGAGFHPMIERTKVKHYYFEEEPQVEIRYTHEGRLRDYVFTPEPVARADFFVNMPKFKSHPWTTVTFSMKNYIGIQDDRHRLIDHDHRLDEKVADLQHIVQPKLVVIDCIIAGEGRMLTPIPRKMGLIIIGNNQPAIDAVGCAMIGVDPRDVPHIRLASERGFGPIDLDQIEIGGDVTFEEARNRALGFKVGLVRVEKYFEGTAITAYAGPPPEKEHTEYCWGGCPGALEEAIEILRLFDAQCDAKMPRLHIVFGAYRGAIDAKPGEKIIFIGDCAEWKGRVGSELVQIESKYKSRDTLDPHHAKHDDIYAKMASVTTKMALSRNKQVLRLEGCPVSVAEQVLALVGLSEVKNPYFDPRQVVEFNKAYVAWRASTVAKRLRGIPYQRPGLAERGDGAPKLDPKTAAYLAKETTAAEEE
jgi:uncharacterized protein (DUF362 family)